MGIHILTHNPMNISLGNIVWKHIADEECTARDLTDVDEKFVGNLKRIRRLKLKKLKDIIIMIMIFI
jgi:hypothetical protein